jgi:hypothetical protein
VVRLGENIEGGRYEVRLDFSARVMTESVRGKVGAIRAHSMGEDSTGSTGTMVGGR